MKKLVLVRHGQSQWNLDNRFTGWVDIDLSPQGKLEAKQAGALLRDAGLTVFDVAYTSVLKRAIRTLNIVADELDLLWVPQIRAWQLNERHYGALQGLNKKESVERFGEAQVHAWRRGYAVEPPALLASDDPNKLAEDRRYKGIPVPTCESLKTTLDRVIPYWNNVIAPDIRVGKNVLIAAHGNSLRALVKHLDEVGDDDISELNIPTGIPLVYELDDQLKPLRHYYLGNPEAVAKAAAAVASQTK